MADETKEFDAILEGADSNHSGGLAPAWERWPEKVKRFIAHVCHLNDSGKKSFSVATTVRLIESRLGYKVTSHTVTSFTQRELGRRTWRRKGNGE